MSIWEFFVWFFWVYIFFACIAIFVRVIIDVFRSHDLTGWAKALWLLFLVFLPFLGAFIYLIVRGQSMGERSAERSRRSMGETDDYIRSVASQNSATSEIESAKRLLDSGAITPAEFETLKANALRS